MKIVGIWLILGVLLLPSRLCLAGRWDSSDGRPRSRATARPDSSKDGESAEADGADSDDPSVSNVTKGAGREAIRPGHSFCALSGKDKKKGDSRKSRLKGGDGGKRPATGMAETSQGPGRNGAARASRTNPAGRDKTSGPVEVRELGYEETAGRRPFQRPKPAHRLRHWSMALDVGVAFAVPSDSAPAKAGLSLTLRGGWRFLSLAGVGLYLGIQTSVVSFRKKETQVLNPDSDPEQQVSCRDYREFNVWSLGGGLWLQAVRGDMVFGLGAVAGGGYVEQRQLKRHPDDPQVLACGYDRASVWAPVVTAWAEVGWRFSPGVIVSLTGGFRGLFSDKRFTFENEQGDLEDRAMVFHVPFLTASLIHRF